MNKLNALLLTPISCRTVASVQRFLFTLFFVSLPTTNVQANVSSFEPVPDAEEVLRRFVQVGSARLALLEKQNLENERKGQAWKNQYIVYMDCRQLLTDKWHNAASTCPNQAKINEDIRIFDQRHNTSSKKTARFYVFYLDKFEITFKKDVSITNYSSLLKAANDESAAKTEKVQKIAESIIGGVDRIFSECAELKKHTEWAALSLGTVVHKNNVGKSFVRNFYYDQTGGTRLAPKSKGACYFHKDAGTVLHPEVDQPCIMIEETVNEAISAFTDIMAPTPSAAYASYQCGSGAGEERTQGGNGLVVNYARSVSEEAIREALRGLSETRSQTGGVTARLFLTDARTLPAEKEIIANQVKSLQPKDIVIWVDFNAQGQGTPQFYFGSSYAPLTNWQRLVREVFGEVNLNPGNINPLTALLDGLAWMVSRLKIPERFYNPDHVDAATGKNDFNPTLADIYYYTCKVDPGSPMRQAMISSIPGVGGLGRDERYAAHRAELAFMCGFWNGVVGQVQGLPELPGWLIKIATNQPDEKGVGTRDAFLEEWEKFKATCAANPASATYGGCVWDMLWARMKQAHTQGGPCLIAAQIGSDVANLATFFLAFAKAGQLAKVSQLLGTLDVATYIFRGAGLLLRYTLPALPYAYRLGSASVYLVVRTAGNGAQAAFEIMASEGRRLLYTLNKGLDDLPGMPGYSIVQQGDKLILGIDRFPAGGQIEDILDEAGQRIQDAYGNYLSQIKDASGNYYLAITKVRGSGGLSNDVVGLAAYATIRKHLANSRVLQYIDNNRLYTVSNKKYSSFEELLRQAHPDVLKYMNQMDEFDFAEMARGFRDLLTGNRVSTFENAIKSADDFYGQYNGWFNYWKLTPGLKYSMTTIEDLRAAGKLLPIGEATDLGLAYLQTFTRKGDYINIPLRYEKAHFLGEFGQKGLDNITQCLNEFRKIPERVIKGEVFSGKTFSKADFESRFVGGIGKVIEYESFVSSSLKREVAEGFIELTAKHAGGSDKIAVIQRIISKSGVYIDDLSDWGNNLGRSRHFDAAEAIQVQEEVLMNAGRFKQTAEPLPILNEKGEHLRV